MIKSNWRTLRRSRRTAVGRKRGLASQRIQREKRALREADAETLRHRSLADSRGEVLREGCTYRIDGVAHWRVIRSIRGRTDQRDVMINGRLFKTCGPRRLPAWLR